MADSIDYFTLIHLVVEHFNSIQFSRKGLWSRRYPEIKTKHYKIIDIINVLMVGYTLDSKDIEHQENIKFRHWTPRKHQVWTWYLILQKAKISLVLGHVYWGRHTY